MMMNLIMMMMSTMMMVIVMMVMMIMTMIMKRFLHSKNLKHNWHQGEGWGAINNDDYDDNDNGDDYGDADYDDDDSNADGAKFSQVCQVESHLTKFS